MGNDDKNMGKPTSVPSGRQMVRELAERSGAAFDRTRPTPGAMHNQGGDWSHGHACIPQKFVRLIGHRDPQALPTFPLPQRPMRVREELVPSDTPIG